MKTYNILYTCGYWHVLVIIFHCCLFHWTQGSRYFFDWLYINNLMLLFGLNLFSDKQHCIKHNRFGERIIYSAFHRSDEISSINPNLCLKHFHDQWYLDGITLASRMDELWSITLLLFSVVLAPDLFGFWFRTEISFLFYICLKLVLIYEFCFLQVPLMICTRKQKKFQ